VEQPLGEARWRADTSENSAVDERMKITPLPLAAGTRFNTSEFF